MHPGTENDTRKGNNGNGKKKIIIKKKRLEAESLSFRLIDFNIYDKNVEVSGSVSGSVSTEEQHVPPGCQYNQWKQNK